MVNLTQENYFSTEAMQEYFSASQYKDFIGTMGMKGCESMALAKMRGQWKQEMTTALLVGSYVDAHFEGCLDVFKSQHPEIMTQKMELKAEYKQANEIIARVERDEYFMKFMSGDKQKIFTGEIFGVQWKCKVDSLLKSICISDLKVMRAIRESFWVKDYGTVSFVEFWGYNIQAAIYQKLVEINTGEKLPFYICVATKEKYPDIEIIGFTDNDLETSLTLIKPNIERIRQLKAGEVEPDRCEDCDFCKATKVLTKPIHFSELILKV